MAFLCYIEAFNTFSVLIRGTYIGLVVGTDSSGFLAIEQRMPVNTIQVANSIELVKIVERTLMESSEESIT